MEEKMEVNDWVKKELEKLYVNIFIIEEETYVKRNEEVKKQKIYIFIGLNLKGYKDIIGIYTPEEETTGYWIKEIANIKARGVQDIFMIKIEEGEMVAVTGPSGAGKSTLLQICAGLMKPTRGNILFDGNDLYAMKNEKFTEFRRNHISYIFQHFNLLPMLTAHENIAVPSLLNDIKPNEDKLREITDILGITSRLEHFPSELSGGEQQRVAIARALINNPQCIFADEPTGNLDGDTTREVMDLFCKLNQNGRTIMIVTHDPEVAKYCNRVINIVDGKIK